MDEQEDTHNPEEHDSDPANESAEHGSESALSAQNAAPKASRRAGAGIAWLAILLALGAGGLSGWLWWQDWRGEQPPQSPDPAFKARVAVLEEDLRSQSMAIEKLQDETERLGASVDKAVAEAPQALDERLTVLEERHDELGEAIGEYHDNSLDSTELESRFEEISRAGEQTNERISSLSKDLDKLTSAVDGLESRIAENEAATPSSTGIDRQLADARFQLLLLETAALLELGQTHAGSGAGYSAAITHYERARSLLQDASDSRLSSVLGSVSAELTSLREARQPDWTTVIAEVAALEAEVSAWPLVGSRVRPSEEPKADDAEEKGFASGLKRTLGSLVRVTPRASAPLSEAAEESLRERLRLHLAAVQAAAARHDRPALAASAGAAGAMVREQFDTGSRSVADALDRLSDLVDLADQSASSLPDLGAALAEVRRKLGES